MFRYFILILFSCLIYSCENKKGLAPKENSTSSTANSTSSCSCWSYSVCIKPILVSRCSGCHSSSPNFADYNDTKAKVDDGTFKNRVITLKDMPLGGPALSQTELERIQCWLNNGAPNN